MARRHSLAHPNEALRLPPDISMAKEFLPNGAIYVFRHRTLGMLGRIRIQERATGGSHLVCEAAGDPDDPNTARRAAYKGPADKSRRAGLQQRQYVGARLPAVVGRRA
jgi:hypothetical protein